MLKLAATSVVGRAILHGTVVQNATVVERQAILHATVPWMQQRFATSVINQAILLVIVHLKASPVTTVANKAT